MGVAGIEYDPSKGILETALRYSSTIIPMVLGGAEFWMLLVFNLTICITRRFNLFEPEHYNVDLPWGLTGVTGSLMTFFVCFYNQHVFGRYNKLYNLTTSMSEHCVELVSVVRVQVADLKARRRIAKLVLASCFMFYYERTDDPEKMGMKVSDSEFNQMRSLGLVGDEEIKHLQKHCRRMESCSLPSFLVLQWAMELMRAATPEPEERDDMLCGFYERVYKVRKCQAEVSQILDLPMPFQYFHIMNLMLMLNLLLWAYSLGCQDSLFAPVIYMFVQMMFQGIRELSTALSDPFGCDEVDFPVNDWMMTLYSRVYGMLEDKHDVRTVDFASVAPLLDPSVCKPWISMYNTREEGKSAERDSEYQKVSQNDDEDPESEDLSEMYSDESDE